MVSELVFHIGGLTAGGAAIRSALTQVVCPPGGPSLACVNRMNSQGLSAALLAKGGVAKAGAAKGQMKIAAKRFGRLADRIARSGTDVAVVSDEGLAAVEPAALAGAIARYLPQYRDKVHVIAYVRPHFDRLWAAYARAVGAGGTKSPEQFIDAAIASGQYTYAPRFEAWRAEFGDRFILRPLIQTEMVGGDVGRDFLHALPGLADFEVSDFDSVSGPDSGVTPGDLAMLRAFHRTGAKKPGPARRLARVAAGRHLCGVLENMATPEGRAPRFSRPLSLRIQARYSDDARGLDQVFFDRPLMQTALSEAVEISPDTPPSSRMADHFDAEGQRLAALWATLSDDLLARRPDDWPAHFRELRSGGVKKAGRR